MEKKPLVYACSGCSAAAQMANWIAIRLDRAGVAEMSCIAGVGGDVVPLVKAALSAADIIGIDGCPLHCVASTLARHGLKCSRHFDLSIYAVKKNRHGEFDPEEARCIHDHIAALICRTNE